MSRRVLFGLAVLTLLALACGAPSSPSTSPQEDAPGRTTEEPAADACAGLDEIRCITSQDCTLILPEGGREYRCRAAEGRCEQGFRQHDADAEACEAKEGCRFVPGQCYCSPDVTCICGGGPPPQCVEADDPAS